MTLSPRLTRAAFAFLLFGTAAALLPSQDSAALAVNGCFTGPPGSTGQLAIAPTAATVQDSYILTPTVTNYKIYFKPDSASSYTQVNTGEAQTNFVRNSGQVAVNGTPYSVTNPPSISAASFTAAQAASFVGKTTYYTGSMTVTTNYFATDMQGNKTQYTATANFSTNP